jgi:hypothetical protein
MKASKKEQWERREKHHPWLLKTTTKLIYEIFGLC